ncbi:MAG: SulP family inorganic anion transporter [Pyrinomonadaceae bacterium]
MQSATDKDDYKGMGNIQNHIPSLAWIPNYKTAWLKYDSIAGLTTAAVVIPQAMAYATIAGLPVQVGMYAALFPMIVYAFLGTSRVLSVSVTSTISILAASALASAVGNTSSNQYLTAAATLALLTGIFLILGGVFRLGVLANLISQPVLTGFKAGVGIMIFIDQLPKVLGLTIPKGSTFATLENLLSQLSNINRLTFGLSAFTLAVLLLVPRFSKKIPAALLAVAFAIALSMLFALGTKGVSLVGTVPSGLPSLSIPSLDLVGELWKGALGIAVMSFTESIAAARAFVVKTDPPIDANQELIALGFANIGGAFTQAYTGGGGTSQTAVNRDAGAKTQISGIVTALTVALVLLFLSGLIAQMPNAALGAIVLLAAIGLVNLREFKDVLKFSKVEFAWALIATIGVVSLGTLNGIFLAVIISIITILYQSSYPPLYQLARKPGSDVFRRLSHLHPNDEVLPGLLMIRTEGRLHFASAPNIKDKVLSLVAETKPKVVAFEMAAVPDIEFTAFQMLNDFYDDLADNDVELWLIALNQLPLEEVRKTELGVKLTNKRMFFTMSEAFEAYKNRA